MNASDRSEGAGERQFSTDHLLQNLRGRSVRGAAITISAQLLKFILQLGTTSVLARLLTPADFGLVAMVAAFTGFVSLFNDLGLSVTTVQRERITHAQVSTLFWINVALSVAFMLIVGAMAPFIAWFYGEPRLTWITWAVGATFIFGGLTAQHGALLRRQMRFGSLALIEVAAMTVGIGVAIVFTRWWPSYWALVLMNASTAAASMSLIWLFVPWRPGLPRRGIGVRSMLASGGNLSTANALNYIGTNLDDVLIGRWWGASVLGMYSKAYGLLTMPMRQLTVPLGSVAVSAMSRALARPAQYRREYLSLGRQLTLVTAPPIAAMIICSDWLVTLVLGRQWLEAARLFSILGFAAFLFPVWNSSGWLFVSQGRLREHLRFHIVDSLVKVLSILIGLPWGAPGVAVGVAVRYYVVLPFLFWMIGRRGPVSMRDLFGMLALPLPVAAACLAAVAMFRAAVHPASPFWGLVGAMAVATITPCVLLLAPSGRTIAREAISSLRLLRPSESP